MANYPSIPQIYGSVMQPSDGTIVDRALSGKVRLRSYYSAIRYTITVLHDVDGAEKNLVWAHYLAHRYVAFNLVFIADGQTIAVRYSEPPLLTPIAGTNRWSIQTNLVST